MKSFLKNISYSALRNSNKNESNRIESDIKVKIGLEIHARILSNTKIFSDSNCSELINSLPNSNASNFDISLPGTMPTLNRRCVEAGLMSAIGLNCQINAMSKFERKHYFYADLPAGYQITQQREPLAFNGICKYPVINPKTHKLLYKQVRIRQLQLEHDSARSLKTESLNFDNATTKFPKNSTLIDFNRCGQGLMEIVTEPDFENAFDCYSFVRELALVLKSIGTCSANMSNGEFRVDVNVSCHKLDPTNKQLLLDGVRVELKNLNSFSSVLKATEIEITRQKSLIKSDKLIKRETRTYDSIANKTIAIRTKEDKYDYRFMPEPNLLPLIIYPSKSFEPDKFLKCLNNKQLVFDTDYLNKINYLKENSDFYVDLDKINLDLSNKVLPQQRRDYIKQTYGLTDEICFIFIANDLDKIFIEILKNYKQTNQNILVKVLLNEYLNQVNKNIDLDKFSFEIKCKKISSYVDLLEKKLISKRIHFKFFTLLFQLENMDKQAIELAEKEQLFLISDIEQIKQIVKLLFDSNPKALNDYKLKSNKREKVFDFFVGRVHKEFNDLADQELVDEIILKALKDLIKI